MATESWINTYNELIQEVVRKGYPEELGHQIAKNLRSENTMYRMIRYLQCSAPRSAEEIVDEMLAIMSDRDRWIEKKKSEEANVIINDLISEGFGEEPEEDQN